jgi:hypothetical protein
LRNGKKINSGLPPTQKRANIMPKLITNTQIKKALKNCGQREYLDIILEIVQACPQAREFLTFRLTEDHNEILDKYKKKVRHEFYPTHGDIGNLHLKDAKKAISDFTKLCSDRILSIEIKLYYVENCIEFTNDYGDIGESFYNSAVSVYAQVVKEINAAGDDIYKKFADRLRSCVDNTRNIGYGFHDELYELHSEIIYLH